jgi:hypothetical protein
VCHVPAAKPGLLDLKGKKKWDAWNTKKGKANLRDIPAEVAASCFFGVALLGNYSTLIACQLAVRMQLHEW